MRFHAASSSNKMITMTTTRRRSNLINVMVALAAFMIIMSHNEWIMTASAFTLQQQPQRRHSCSSCSFAGRIEIRRVPISVAQSRPMTTKSPTTAKSTITTTKLFGLLDFLSPYESKIPPELKDEIYKAEANTSAAKDRGKRIAVYTVIAIIGVSLAVFNGFLTEIRMTGIDGNGLGVVPPEDGSTRVGVEVLVEAGFGWVLTNPVYKFLFTNKIGGGLCILLGGASGLLAEAELDTKRLNAEKIYEELERRREQKMKKKTTTATNPKKRRSGKETKRLSALSEVITPDEETSSVAVAAAGAATATKSISENIEHEKDQEDATADHAESLEKQQPNTNKGSLLDQMKSIYEKADSMAASSALLLNKQLEDAGVVEKITDDTGLRVIGKEEAKKLQEQKRQQEQNQEK